MAVLHRFCSQRMRQTEGLKESHKGRHPALTCASAVERDGGTVEQLKGESLLDQIALATSMSGPFI
jgi:hypothetical protein